MSELPDVINVPITNTFTVRYIKERTCFNSGTPGVFICSECGDVWRKPAVDLMNYCPNCGAKVVE